MGDSDDREPLDLTRYEGHTPGPHEYIEEEGAVHGPHGSPIALMTGISMMAGSLMEVHANGRLFADATALLAEVRRFRKVFELVKDWYDGDGRRDDYPAMLADALVDLHRDRREALRLRAALEKIAVIDPMQLTPGAEPWLTMKQVVEIARTALEESP